MAISKEIRRFVSERAGNRCEYCRKPDAISAQPFHVDHIVSLKHDGSDDLENLAWACFQCNVSKGTDIAGLDGLSGNITALYNPRQQSWEDHFLIRQTEIIGQTPTGQVTVRLLQMNHPDQIEVRQTLIEAGLW